jgi:sugar lactone lactonase YvrE
MLFKKITKILFRCVAIIMVVILGLCIYLYVVSPINPVPWQPAPNPGFTGEFLPNSKLSSIDKVMSGVGIGPEDIAKGPNGYYYTGYRDGRIVRFDSDGMYEVFVNTHGKPLGMEFDANGNLIVADADKGLLSINDTGEITVLTDSVNGVQMLFVDDLDIARDGTIWFSDATMLYSYDDSIYSLLENKATGRLLSYSPVTKATVVHIENLQFANGVALGPNDNYVLVNETGGSKIRRLWLKGAKKNENDIFYDGFPGAPDNLSFNGIDTFWVAFAGIRIPGLDALADKPLIRKLIGGLPKESLIPKNKHGFIVGLNLEGEVIHNFQDQNSPIQTITSVNQWGNTLFIGNLASDFIALYELN